MCGRYAFDDIAEIYEARALLEAAANSLGSDALAQVKHGEVFPTENALVVAQSGQGHGPQVMQWGYPLHGSSRPVINARSETLGEKPMFRRSVISKMCLVPCTGFFEWQKKDDGKQKFLIGPEGVRFFYLAGLYSAFGGAQANRFVIVTAPANKAMRQVHHRMPLIVPPGAEEVWLSGNASCGQRVQSVYDLTGAMWLEAV